ncbi:type VII secretion integral membrane protein EccD [Mycobacterium shinjukuense]|uniref:ESX-4 secretion system protein eccD4 n=1 Tax=Mycobacterium shinjukuense TaxID=398694 RepID=A0A7I7MU67_9MYCO|nr:type VII secretion integral membrane protein EccD [Mycobacterium shinjukuense]MCV6987326.1 type VII secretion integral membrane protein EccD [Mycobacterium shinjukuense]ORB72015.1 type VII secretion integral membrane protein EccD [Mycobacterium shinjukuense]BBX74769.1 ESX-4 secretion system protein eccD4 [Mycobacterium shinjukuense]
MSASDASELRRVAVHAGDTVVDLALPAAVPVATLIPLIVDMLGIRYGERATRYRLSRPGAPALPGAMTLAQNGIHDGAVLLLTESITEPPVARCDDVAEAISATLAGVARAGAGRATRITAALAAVGLTGIGCAVLIRNEVSANAAGATAGAAAAAGMAALAFAGIAGRAYRDPIAGLTLSVVATAFAAVGGLLAVPGALGVPNVLLAAMAAAVAAVLAMRVTGCGVVTLTAMACSAAVVAAAALVGVITAAPPPIIGSLGMLACFGLLEVAARASIALAGLSPRLSAEPDPDPADLLATKAIRASDWLTSLLAAFSATAALGAIVTVLASPHLSGFAVASAAGASLLLRARGCDGGRTVIFAVSGIGVMATTFAVAALRAPAQGPLLVTLTAMLAAVAMCLGFVAPAMVLSPVARRSVEILECLALLGLVPLTCWVCGFFGAIRGLDLT